MTRRDALKGAVGLAALGALPASAAANGRDRAAHAGPIDEDTLVYRIELHAVSPGD